MHLLLDWLLHNGIGQNISAGVLVFVAGWLWSRTKFWPLHALHSKLDALRQGHRELHAKLDEHARRHDEHAEHLHTLGRSLVELHEKLDRMGDGPGPHEES